MTDNMSQRIDAMFRIDKLWAWGFVAGLWLAYAFVFFAINSINTNGHIKVALMIGGALVVLYNTASISAMIGHYEEDKEHIYGLDIKHLDDIKAQKINTK